MEAEDIEKPDGERDMMLHSTNTSTNFITGTKSSDDTMDHLLIWWKISFSKYYFKLLWYLSYLKSLWSTNLIIIITIVHELIYSAKNSIAQQQKNWNSSSMVLNSLSFDSYIFLLLLNVEGWESHHHHQQQQLVGSNQQQCFLVPFALWSEGREEVSECEWRWMNCCITCINCCTKAERFLTKCTDLSWK